MKGNYKTVIVRWVLPLLGLMAAALLVYLGTVGMEKKEAKETVEGIMISTVEKHGVMIDTELSGALNAGELILALIEEQNVRTPEKLSGYLKAVADRTCAETLVYRNDKGVSVNQNGETVKLEDQSWFSEELMKAEEPVYFYLKESEGEQEESILMAVPGPDGSSAVYIWIPAEIIKNLMVMNDDFNRPVIGILLDGEGNILTSTGVNSNFTNGTNLWSNLNEAESDTAAVRAELESRKEGAFEASAGKENRTLVYVPVSAGEWMFVAGLDQAYVDRQEKNLWENTGRVLGIVLIAVVVFGVVFVVTNISGRIKNAANSKVLEEKADTDLLTGLNNKLATERKIKEYMQENPNELAMMFLLDIDNFKKINDTMGHAFGDEVLRTLGKKISGNFRMTDIIGRTGGDEFTIFLKALKDDSNTLREAQKLITFFRNFQVGEYTKYSATASIGAAVFPAHGKDFETLYKAADQALYKAKKRGKNQLAFYDDRDRM